MLGFRKTLRAFGKDESGAFAILFGFVFMILVGITGAAVDYARAHLLKSELASALDAAGLAAGSSISSDAVEDIAQKYFDVNYPVGYLGSTVSEIDFDIDGDVVNLSVTATLDYSLLGLFNDGKINVAAATEVTIEKRGMEIVLVMDNTGSMLTNDKIGTMKTAATKLINIIYGDNNEIDDLWVGLVPYVASVNIGNQYTGWVNNLDQDDFAPTTWKGCVMARNNVTSDDTAAVGGKWDVYRWYSSRNYGNAGNRWLCSSHSSNSCPTPRSSTGPSENIYTTYWDCYPNKCWVNENYEAGNYANGPNKSCATPITPLTKSKATVQAGIDAMQSWADGGTTSDVGLAWGWRVISPKWKGLWSGVAAAQPFDYDEPLVDKVIVLLTDGRNDVGNSMSSHGVFRYSSQAQVKETEIDNNVTALCNNIKAEGVTLYTITFAVSGSIQGIYQNCATSPAHYFDSPSNSELDGVFEEIGDSLSNLRISK